MISALLDISPSRLTRPVHVIANDTLVESPLVAAHLHQSLQEIRHAAEMLALPITVATTNPNSDNTFWVLLIGKGYPSPNSTMRWCTDRLKIQPTSRYILDQVAACGSAIILLGVRKDESAARRRSVEAYRNDADSRLHPHKDLKGAFVYRPIVDLATDDVWEILASHSPPWGGTHNRLIKLYRVPMIIDTPLARLSETHCDNLLRYWASDAERQVILLAQDKEIGADEYRKLADAVSKTYLLRHHQVREGVGASEAVANAYFGEEA